MSSNVAKPALDRFKIVYCSACVAAGSEHAAVKWDLELFREHYAKEHMKFGCYRCPACSDTQVSALLAHLHANRCAKSAKQLSNPNPIFIPEAFNDTAKWYNLQKATNDALRAVAELEHGEEKRLNSIDMGSQTVVELASRHTQTDSKLVKVEDDTDSEDDDLKFLWNGQPKTAESNLESAQGEKQMDTSQGGGDTSTTLQLKNAETVIKSETPVPQSLGATSPAANPGVTTSPDVPLVTPANPPSHESPAVKDSTTVQTDAPPSAVRVEQANVIPIPPPVPFDSRTLGNNVSNPATQFVPPMSETSSNLGKKKKKDRKLSSAKDSANIFDKTKVKKEEPVYIESPASPPPWERGTLNVVSANTQSDLEKRPEKGMSPAKTNNVENNAKRTNVVGEASENKARSRGWDVKRSSTVEIGGFCNRRTLLPGVHYPNAPLDRSGDKTKSPVRPVQSSAFDPYENVSKVVESEKGPGKRHSLRGSGFFFNNPHNDSIALQRHTVTSRTDGQPPALGGLLATNSPAAVSRGLSNPAIVPPSLESMGGSPQPVPPPPITSSARDKERVLSTDPVLSMFEILRERNHIPDAFVETAISKCGLEKIKEVLDILGFSGDLYEFARFVERTGPDNVNADALAAEAAVRASSIRPLHNPSAFQVFADDMQLSSDVEDEPFRVLGSPEDTVPPSHDLLETDAVAATPSAEQISRRNTARGSSGIHIGRVDEIRSHARSRSGRNDNHNSGTRRNERDIVYISDSSRESTPFQVGRHGERHYTSKSSKRSRRSRSRSRSHSHHRRSKRKRSRSRSRHESRHESRHSPSSRKRSHHSTEDNSWYSRRTPYRHRSPSDSQQPPENYMRGRGRGRGRGRPRGRGFRGNY